MKLLKFDTLYPANYINSKMQSAKVEIREMTFIEYRDWLIKLRMNFSDFYTYNLSLYGWDAQEIFLDNKPFKLKSEKYYFGRIIYLFKLLNRLRNLFAVEKIQFKEILIKKIIQIEKPDVIFVREHSTIRSKFWEQFSSQSLLVCRMDCNLPREWSPLSFDLIYTNIPYYRDFFKSNLIPTNSNSNGFDTRLIEEISGDFKKFDLVYVGGLGDKIFTERTVFFETLLSKSSGKFKFNWWGYKMGDFDNQYPELARTYMGPTGGIEMFKKFAESRIVLNYFETTETKNSYNQRIFEVMGCGTLLLAKESETFFEWGSCLVTYKSIDDCIEKIVYFLINEFERESIALEGQKFILKKYNYKELMRVLSSELNSAYNHKFGI